MWWALTQKEMQIELKNLAASQAQAQTQIEVRDLVRVSKEVLWSVGDLQKQVGGLSNSVGQGLEAYAMERISPILEQRFRFVTESLAPEAIGIDGDEYDFDVVYRSVIDGRAVAVLCEVKTNITPAEVRDFSEIVNRVRQHVGADDVRMLFFGYRAGHKAQQVVADCGAMLAFPRGPCSRLGSAKALPNKLTSFRWRHKLYVMAKTQIQLSDELYRRVKDFAQQREWSLTETFRRAVEQMFERYPQQTTPPQGWQVPTIRDAGWRGLAPGKLHETALTDSEPACPPDVR